jgi:pilus assembly protein CpaB
MRGVFGLVLAAGVALAGGAVYLAQGYIAQTEAALAAEQQARALTGPLVEVFVVNKPKLYGEPLTKEDVQVVWMQEQFLPTAIFRATPLEGEQPLFPENIEDPRYILRQMEAGEAILAVKVTEPGQPAGLTGQLAAGMRAFAINVDVSSGVSGFLQPGDRVDIYWTGVSDTTGSEFTKLIESAVSIVAVDQLANERSSSATIARTVTVSATPEQVGRLAQAQATGKLALALVGNNDAVASGPVNVDGTDLSGETAQVVIQEEQAEVCTIKTRKGDTIIETPIPCTN